MPAAGCASCVLPTRVKESHQVSVRHMDRAVYRVTRGPVNTWVVHKERGGEPLGSFSDRGAAVRYALILVRKHLELCVPRTQ